MAAETRTELLAALATLRDDDREVLGARFLLDLSEAETADTLGIARGTVKSRTSRALGPAASRAAWSRPMTDRLLREFDDDALAGALRGLARRSSGRVARPGALDLASKVRARIVAAPPRVERGGVRRAVAWCLPSSRCSPLPRSPAPSGSACRACASSSAIRRLAPPARLLQRLRALARPRRHPAPVADRRRRARQRRRPSSSAPASLSTRSPIEPRGPSCCRPTRRSVHPTPRISIAGGPVRWRSSGSRTTGLPATLEPDIGLILMTVRRDASARTSSSARSSARAARSSRSRSTASAATGSRATRTSSSTSHPTGSSATSDGGSAMPWCGATATTTYRIESALGRDATIALAESLE